MRAVDWAAHSDCHRGERGTREGAWLMRDYINEIAIRAVMWAWRFWLALWGIR